MAVRLVKGIEREIDSIMGQKVQEIVATERGLAPVESGNLAGSISGRKVSLGNYTVSTNAVGRNGFAYPLLIERGEQVVANGKALRFVINGRVIYAKTAGPSAQSRYAQKTIAAYGGKYVG